MLDLILASGSPRRRELLELFAIPFRIEATEAEEEQHAPQQIVDLLPPARVDLHDHPSLRAWRKANAVCDTQRESVIIAADTIVVLDQQVLNKPVNSADACAMLRRLAGREHRVYTGIVLLDTRTQHPGPVLQIELVSSQVAIAALTDDQIAGYVATGEPLDKAGAYGIQGIGGTLVEQVIGSYTNVVGLPIVTLQHLLMNAGLAGLPDPQQLYQHWLRMQGKDAFPCPPTSP